MRNTISSRKESSRKVYIKRYGGLEALALGVKYMRFGIFFIDIYL